MPLSTVGVRGRSPDGSERIVRFTQLGGVSQRPGDPFIDKVRVTVEDEAGAVYAELVIGEDTLARAVQRLFAEKIRAAWEKFQAPAPASAQTQAVTRTVDWRQVIGVGLWVFEGAIPEPLRRIAEVVRAAGQPPPAPPPPPTR